ncbi:MAG: Nif3-like dinuclear metal center hexameric protein [Pirellulales bacterium]|nr:Nif3-like dinuclear metal center hexameric protein [Pirellulales bacterium]
MTVNKVADFLARFAPVELAEDWDNVGLLVGDVAACVERLMTCLTITPPVVKEAVERRADLIVAHHPLPFRALKKLTCETTAGRMLLDLIAAGIAVYSPHTGFDSAAEGINQRLARGLGLGDIAPLVPLEHATDSNTLGAGRWGQLDEPVSLVQFTRRVKEFLAIENLQIVGEDDKQITKAAVACGAAGEFLEPARAAGCDCLLVGETNFHTCLEAQATSVALVLPGHYASERFAVESLAGVLAEQFSLPEGGGVEIWPSTAECDPIRWV